LVAVLLSSSSLSGERVRGFFSIRDKCPRSVPSTFFWSLFTLPHVPVVLSITFRNLLLRQSPNRGPDRRPTHPLHARIWCWIPRSTRPATGRRRACFQFGLLARGRAGEEEKSTAATGPRRETRLPKPDAGLGPTRKISTLVRRAPQSCRSDELRPTLRLLACSCRSGGKTAPYLGPFDLEIPPVRGTLFFIQKKGKKPPVERRLSTSGRAELRPIAKKAPCCLDGSQCFSLERCETTSPKGCPGFLSDPACLPSDGPPCSFWRKALAGPPRSCAASRPKRHPPTRKNPPGGPSPVSDERVGEPRRGRARIFRSAFRPGRAPAPSRWPCYHPLLP